jgi:hypothetical protein
MSSTETVTQTQTAGQAQAPERSAPDAQTTQGGAANTQPQSQGKEAPAPWFGDPSLEAYVKNKGWSGPQDAVRSYINAEKFIGRDPATLVSLPKEGDEKAWAELWAKLGRPESPEKYNMKAGLPDGAEVDEVFSRKMAEAIHRAGLTQKQAEAVIAEYNRMLIERTQEDLKKMELDYAAGDKELQNEWKGAYDRMIAVARAAVKDLGIPAEAIDGISAAIGYKNTIKLFADIGRKLGEPGFVPGGETTRFPGALSPEEAKAQWESLKLDPHYMAALMDPKNPGHKEAVERQSRLFAIMHG